MFPSGKLLRDASSNFARQFAHVGDVEMPVIGTCQSPIQLITADALQLAKPKDVLCMDYINKICHGTFVVTEPRHGYFEIDAPSSTDTYPLVSFRRHTFELRRIHIHRKSEHVINAITQADCEVHFVHAQQGSRSLPQNSSLGFYTKRSRRLPQGKDLRNSMNFCDSVPTP